MDTPRPRSFGQSEKLQWIAQRRRESANGFTDWATVQRIAKRLARDTTSDLRSEFEKAMRTNPRWDVHEAFTQMTLKWSDRSNFDDELFLDGAPLGPLETLQVYSTDFSGFDVLERKVFRSGAKSHAPLWCTHSEELSPFNEVMPYADFLEQYRAWKQWREGSPPQANEICSICGGVMIRLLTDEQMAYYEKVEKEAKAREAAELEAGVTRLRPRSRYGKA
jgi:hypothetical protein